MDAAEAQLYIGTVLDGRYEVVQFLGEGHFSGVFEGLDRDSGKEVAIKVLSMRSSLDRTAVNEFAEEVRLLQALESCSNIVNIHADGTDTIEVSHTATGVSIQVPIVYVVLELADASLAELLLFRHQISWSERLTLLREVVKGVHQMHNRRMVHRDVKADNTLVFARGVKAKIADLGRSKDTTAAAAVPAFMYEPGRGDLRFAPPEFLWHQGSSDPFDALRADIYLLGSLLYEMATATGITSVALGDPLAVFANAKAMLPTQRTHEYLSRVADMREQYEVAYKTFKSELPRSIAHDATELLRQLTDPDPMCRELRQPFRNLPVRWDLHWLLVKIDILSKRLAVAEKPRRRYRSKKKVVPKT